MDCGLPTLALGPYRGQRVEKEMNIILTVGWDGCRGVYMAVVTDGSVQDGDENVSVLDVELCKTREDAEEWGRKTMLEKPWETRQ